MPGYKSLPSFMTGEAADQVREAETRHRVGDSDTAVRLLEDALAICVTRGGEMPGWLCGRLAALYRTLGRYDDEVHLLERYRESQTSEEARTRYDARLSKARTIAERKRRSESGALSSVREALSRPRRRRNTPADGLSASGVLPIAARTITALAKALAEKHGGDARALHQVLADLCDERRRAHAPVDALVAALQTARDQPELTGLDAEARNAVYGEALIELLAIYYRAESD